MNEIAASLEDLLRMLVPAQDKDEKYIKITPEFRVAVQKISEDGVHFIIHPNGYNSNTLDFVAKDNEITLLHEFAEQF